MPKRTPRPRKRERTPREILQTMGQQPKPTYNRGSVLVLDRRCFNKPCALVQHDGDRPVPEGGVLFYATDDFPATVFEGNQPAIDAIQRTIAYHVERGLDGLLQIEHFAVVPLHEYHRDVESKKERAERLAETAKQRQKEPSDG